VYSDSSDYYDFTFASGGKAAEDGNYWIAGAKGNDTLKGSTQADVLISNDGDDTLRGNAGWD
jgi:Ca2+-binding RTX toxin-like protein